ncbi:hypothetical protein [Persicitalea sp.]|uniref:hypothetical protein n=1 Tax=Persicitalea sp. TaxID=3100273 RepID=UPI0035938D1D
MKSVPACCLLFFLFSTGITFGQVKYEKEYRLKAADVPPLARQFVDSLDFARRVRWYMETSEQGKSIEAKSKRDGQKYSVEFDPSGKLQDVEIEVAWRSLPEVLRTKIEQSLNDDFERFKIRKVQRQFSGERKEILNYLKQRSDGSGLTVRYELVLRGRKGRNTDKFEYTFSADGDLEKSAKIVFRNTDNLKY